MRKVIENFGLVILVVGMAYAVIRVGELPFPSFDEESLASYVPQPVKDMSDRLKGFFKATTGGPGVPPQGGQMVVEASRDLARRFQDEEPLSHIVEAQRNCIYEHNARHRVADLYPARVCFIELATIRLGRQMEDVRFPNNDLDTLFTQLNFADIVLFSTQQEREWGSHYAPLNVLTLLKQEQASTSP